MVKESSLGELTRKRRRNGHKSRIIDALGVHQTAPRREEADNSSVSKFKGGMCYESHVSFWLDPFTSYAGTSKTVKK